MDIRLQRLSLKNFKGLSSFDLVANGKNITVMGDNATGKTTLADSFRWLLFGKDSLDQTNFEIKPLDADGNPEHGLEHGVAAQLQVDNKRLQLRKVYAEKWTKKRGSSKKEFTGHTTDYFLDGVPAKLKEYQQRISELCDENLFKLLTNPRFFNEILHWQKRRELLLEVCGDITDQDVIISDESLSKLPEILDGHSLDDYQKILAGRRKEINQELEKIPVRIDELKQSVGNSDVGDENINVLNLKTFQEELAAKQQELSRIQTGGEIAEKTKALRELEGKIADLQNQQQAKRRKAIDEKQTEIDKLKKGLREVEASRDGAKFTIQTNQERVNKYHLEMEDLRAKFHDIDKQIRPSSSCPTCGQELPEEQLDEIISKFNLDKSKQLDSINSEGKKLKTKVEELQVENEVLRKRADEATKKVEALSEKIDSITAEISNPEENNHESAPELQNLLSDKETLETLISELRVGSHDAEAECQAEIEKLSGKITEIQAEFAKVETSKKAKARIEELKQQERELGAEFEKTEAELSLCEKFIWTKVKMLEEKINSKFWMVRFKLFQEQINEGIKETCEITVGGVPYGSLNNGARINAGLDIINTLSDHFQIRAPIFIDNSEAVTNLLETKAQQIRLVVNEQDKELRIITEPDAAKKAA